VDADDVVELAPGPPPVPCAVLPAIPEPPPVLLDAASPSSPHPEKIRVKSIAAAAAVHS
jgi:hypothetical protein